MPINKKWSQANSSHIKANAPTKSGVYELKAFGKLVYIGKASNIRQRLLEHLGERNPNYYRYKTTGLLQSAGSMERDHLKRYGNSKEETPPWNERMPRA